MVAAVRKIGAWLSEPTQTSRGMTILAWTLLTVVSFGGVASAAIYVNDQREEDRERAVTQCLVRVESRDQLRGVFIDVFDLIEDADPSPSQFAESARNLLNENYPAIDPGVCQEIE